MLLHFYDLPLRLVGTDYSLEAPRPYILTRAEMQAIALLQAKRGISTFATAWSGYPGLRNLCQTYLLPPAGWAHWYEIGDELV